MGLTLMDAMYKLTTDTDAESPAIFFFIADVASPARERKNSSTYIGGLRKEADVVPLSRFHDPTAVLCCSTNIFVGRRLRRCCRSLGEFTF